MHALKTVCIAPTPKLPAKHHQIAALSFTVLPALALPSLLSAAPRQVNPRGWNSCAFSSYDGCFRTFMAGCVKGCTSSQPMDRWLVCISLCDGDIERSCAGLGCFSSGED